MGTSTSGPPNSVTTMARMSLASHDERADIRSPHVDIPRRRGIASQSWTARWRAWRPGCRDSAGTPPRDAPRACAWSRGGISPPADPQDADARIRTFLVADEGALPVVLYQIPVVSRATETVDADARPHHRQTPSRARRSSTVRSTRPTLAHSSRSSPAGVRRADRAPWRRGTPPRTSRPTSRAPRAS